MPLWWYIFLWELAPSVIHLLAWYSGYMQNSVSCLVFENVGDQMLVPNRGMRFEFSVQVQREHRTQHEWRSKSASVITCLCISLSTPRCGNLKAKIYPASFKSSGLTI